MLSLVIILFDNSNIWFKTVLYFCTYYITQFIETETAAIAATSGLVTANGAQPGVSITAAPDRITSSATSARIQPTRPLLPTGSGNSDAQPGASTIAAPDRIPSSATSARQPTRPVLATGSGTDSDFEADIDFEGFEELNNEILMEIYGHHVNIANSETDTGTAYIYYIKKIFNNI